MKRTKYFFSVFLVIVMLLSAAPMSGVAKINFKSNFASTASAETYGDYEYTVSGSNAKITKYKGSASTVSIPSTLGGKTVTTIEAGAFAGNTSLTSVSIPSTVTQIGGKLTTHTGAFEKCTKLQIVTFAEGSDDAVIGCNTFFGCTSLNKITIPRQYKTLSYRCFGNCINLTTLTLNESIYSYANQSIGESAFYGCSSLKTLSLPNTLKNISDFAFSGCSSIQTLVIPEGVVSIGQGAFAGNTSLTSVSIPSTVTQIGGKLTTHTGAFEKCTKLQIVTFTEGSDDAVIGSNTFSFCTNLTTAHIPSNYTTIYSNAFNGCTNVTICNTTSSCYAKTYADNNGIPFRICSNNHGTITPPATSYTATFKDNSGTKTVSGTKITTPSISSKSGWTSTGWTTTAGVPASVTVAANASYTLTGNKTFYALYKKDLTLTYNANGGQNAPSSQKQTIYYNSCGLTQTAVFSLSKTIPTRDGYKFMGWSTDKNATSASYAAGQTIEMNEKSATTLYAVWQKAQKTEISIEINYKDTFKASINDFNATKYTSDNSNIALVSTDGTITGSGKGSTTVHAFDASGNEAIIHVKVNYSWWQWIIVIVLFGWIWY